MHPFISPYNIIRQFGCLVICYAFYRTILVFAPFRLVDEIMWKDKHQIIASGIYLNHKEMNL